MAWSPASSAASSASAAASSSSSTSSSLVAELFGKPASQGSGSGGIFDSVFSTPTHKGVRREFFASDGQAWKNEQSEYKTWQHKKSSPDKSLPDNERDGQMIPNKNLNSNSNEVVEHTLLSSSVHYGGRDDYIEPSAAEKYSRRTNFFEKGSGEDVSDGGSPRGNFWQGSFYY